MLGFLNTEPACAGNQQPQDLRKSDRAATNQLGNPLETL